jgi:hypothetical protein
MSIIYYIFSSLQVFTATFIYFSNNPIHSILLLILLLFLIFLVLYLKIYTFIVLGVNFFLNLFLFISFCETPESYDLIKEVEIPEEKGKISNVIVGSFLFLATMVIWQSFFLV